MLEFLLSLSSIVFFLVAFIIVVGEGRGYFFVKIEFLNLWWYSSFHLCQPTLLMCQNVLTSLRWIDHFVQRNEIWACLNYSQFLANLKWSSLDVVVGKIYFHHDPCGGISKSLCQVLFLFSLCCFSLLKI